MDGSIPAWAGEPFQLEAITHLDRVYPRVGGGTISTRDYESAKKGLSPRGRGNLLRHPLRYRQSGSIPAWAGEPSAHEITKALRRVYPRVGGGTSSATRSGTANQGLSPRGRGNLGSRRYSTLNLRSIPAWAGEPILRALSQLPFKVYPRVGGGTHDHSSGRFGR